MVIPRVCHFRHRRVSKRKERYSHLSRIVLTKTAISYNQLLCFSQIQQDDIIPGSFAVKSGRVMRQCKNCNAPIGNLERAFAWESSIVCGPCHAKLSAPHVVSPDQVFDSLEDLAKPTQRKSPPIPRPNISELIKMNDTDWGRVMLILGVVVIAIIVFYAVEYWQHNVSGLIIIHPDSISASLKTLPDIPETIDPKFTISENSYGADGTTTGAGWEVTNESQSPLIISRFNINGEFDTPIAYAPFSSWIEQDKSKSFPITLTIGQSVKLEQWSFCYPDDPQYTKQEIFIDIDTDRGNFRYRGYGFEKR